MTDSPIIIALDFAEQKSAWNLIDALNPDYCRLKIGKEMFTHFGPDFVKKVVNKGFDVFLDLKFHDIPHTVAGAVRAAADLGVWMINVHALGGLRMMLAAKETLVAGNGHKPLLIAVTLLTSHTKQELHEIGLAGDISDNVLRLANLTYTAGLDGVVCSAQEALLLRQNMDKDFLLVTPGIRLRQSVIDAEDQQRIITPREAMKLGSNYLVIGRPITMAKNPPQILAQILDEISA